MSSSQASTVQWDKFYNVINGQNRTSEEEFCGVNPSTGEKLWPVPSAGQSDVDEAVEHALNAFVTWRDVPIERRKKTLEEMKTTLLAHGDDLANLLSIETGKPMSISKREILGIGFFFDTHLSLELPEEHTEDAAKIVTTKYVPLGVVGAICPWNSPVLLAIGKILPAILTGNTVIVKPSPYTPYSTLKLVEIVQGVLPKGVVQALVRGDEQLGPMLTSHPNIAKISFTGSIPTGKKIMAACAQTLKRVTLELGGNDAAIVLPDVDVKQTAKELALGSFLNSGQVCVATKRIYIHQDIYKEVLAEMVDFTKTLNVGNPSSGAFLGPIQNSMQYDKVRSLLDDIKTQSYKVAVGEVDPSSIQSDSGYFIKPTIIDNPPNQSRIIQEEPFGPVVPTQPWNDIEEVIARCNATNTGLAACVWSKDVKRAQEIGRRLDVGSVFINSYEKPTPQALFGGHKESGIGGEWGKTGLLAYCNAQVMHTYK